MSSTQFFIANLNPIYRFDEGETLVYAKGMNGIPTLRKLKTWLDEGIVRIKFIKVEDDSERVIYGTTEVNRIPKQKLPKGNKLEENMEQIRMFDMEIFDWRSCLHSKIQEIRIKKGFYEIGTIHNVETMPGMMIF